MEASAASLPARARALLEANWTGRSTVPSRTLYPHQWCWDAAFVAIGLAHVDQGRAQQELESLFTGQWPNGLVPHIVFDASVPADAYFPGPDFWRSRELGGPPDGPDTSGLTQPPLHARAALEIHRRADDRGEATRFLERLYPALAAQHAYLDGRRDVAGEGLVCIVHPWESGLDNAPPWDRPADAAIPPGALPAYERRDLAHADPADRPTDAAYDWFVHLAARYRDSGYDDGALAAAAPFLVEDPLFNAVHAWSAEALASVAELVGDDPGPHRRAAERTRAALARRLRDPATNRLLPRAARDDRLLAAGSVVSLVPLLDPALPRELVARIVADLRSPAFHPGGEGFLVPTFDRTHPAFRPHRYWRGPVWVNTNWLLWRGLRRHGEHDLADEVRRSTVALVERSGFREYFDPRTGEGRGSRDFSWTAALLLDMLAADEEDGRAADT